VGNPFEFRDEAESNRARGECLKTPEDFPCPEANWPPNTAAKTEMPNDFPENKLAKPSLATTNPHSSKVRITLDSLKRPSGLFMYWQLVK
jgi:hypothetical protein